MWIFFASLSAVIERTRQLFLKRMTKSISTKLLTFSSFLFSIPLVTLFLLFQPAAVSKEFLILCVIKAFVDSIGIFLLIWSYSKSDISLVSPFLAFTPFFLLISQPLITGEFPSQAGVVGIIFFVIGGIILGFSSVSADNPQSAWRQIVIQPGLLGVILVAFIWSITTSIDRRALQYANSYTYAFITFTLSAFFTFLPLLRNVKQNIFSLGNDLKIHIINGIFTGASVLAIFLAVARVQSAYAISIRRGSILISVLGGYFLFREKNISTRILGAVFMLFGFLAITLLG